MLVEDSDSAHADTSAGFNTIQYKTDDCRR